MTACQFRYSYDSGVPTTSYTVFSEDNEQSKVWWKIRIIDLIAIIFKLVVY